MENQDKGEKGHINWSPTEDAYAISFFRECA
jgi:hypothetical protein